MRVGSYELEEELGRGAMGSVHRARHVPTGAIRAVKLLVNANPTRVERFRREARALARLDGRGVVQVHEVGDTPLAWIAMDLMPSTLAATLRARGALGVGRAAEIVAKLARTLERAHALGLVSCKRLRRRLGAT